MEKLLIIFVTALMSLLLLAPVGCQHSTPEVVEVIAIFPAEPGSPPPTSGWAMPGAPANPYPDRVQRVFHPGDKMFLGLSLSSDISGEITFSKYTFLNQETGIEEPVSLTDDLGPFEPGRLFLLGFEYPWPVPNTPGTYKIQIYLDDTVAASAIFEVLSEITTTPPPIEDTYTTGQTPPAITAKQPYTGDHGITTTMVAPLAGDKGILVSVNLLPLTLEDLVFKSDVIVIGKVVDILPAKQAPQPTRPGPEIYTDVIVRAEQYLYGQERTLHIAVRVPGGRVGDTVMRVDAAPVFDLREEVALLLSRLPEGSVPPDRIEAVDYYSVTGYNQGKRQYREGIIIDIGGISVAEFERQIASIHGAK